MISAAVFGFLAGLDNFHVCSAIGVLAFGRRQLLWLAAAFTAAEILASLAGLLLGQAVVTPAGRVGAVAGPLLMAVCGSIVLVRNLRGDPPPAARMLMGLPPWLSLDNLAAGAAFGASGHSIAAGLMIGGMGGLLSCLGLFAGARWRGWLPSRFEWLPGAWLCLLALRMWVAP